MSETIIYNKADFEENLYDFFTYMMYKGQPFTGTLIIEEDKTVDNALGNKQIIEFKDGNANGRCIEYHKNGQVIVDDFFEGGKLLTRKCWYPNGQIFEDWNNDLGGKEWYQNGQIKKDSTGPDQVLWDKDGILAQKNGTWFYKNGRKINEKIIDGTVFLYSSIGDVAVRIEKLQKKEFNPESKSFYFNKKYYCHDVLCQFMDELFTDPYPNLDYGSNIILILFGWVGAVYSEDGKKGLDLMDRLIDHPTKITREHASFLKHLALKKESGSRELTYWLEKNPFKIIIK